MQGVVSLEKLYKCNQNIQFHGNSKLAQDTSVWAEVLYRVIATDSYLDFYVYVHGWHMWSWIHFPVNVVYGAALAAQTVSA